MSRTLSKETIYKKLNAIDEFVLEYTISDTSITGITKKATFTHKKCNHVFNMTIKDFISGQRCPLCAKEKRRVNNIKQIDADLLNKINKKGYSIVEYNGITKLNVFKHEDGTIRTCKIDSLFTESHRYRNSSKAKNIKPFTYYKEKQEEKYGNKISVYEDSFITSTTKTRFHCNICNIDFYKKYSDLLYNNQGCPECAKNRYYKNTKYILEKINSCGFTIIGDFEKVTQKTKIDIVCNKCGKTYKKSYTDIFYNDSRCICDKKEISKGESYIIEYLDDHSIEYKYNSTVENLVFKGNLRLDFIININNKQICIEYDGIQHFKENTFFSDDLDTIRKRDIIKNSFCKDNNIDILRISYKNNTKEKIFNILDNFLFPDGKPYEGKLSRTVWIGGKSTLFESYDEYVNNN